MTTDDRPTEPVDGNVLAGVLTEAWGRDVTATDARCVACGRIRVVADLVVYDAGLGLVGRCRGCGEVMLRVVRIREELVVDTRGMALSETP